AESRPQTGAETDRARENEASNTPTTAGLAPNRRSLAYSGSSGNTMPNPTRSRATVVQMVVNPGGRGALLEVRARRRTATGNGELVPGVKSTPGLARCVVPSHAAVQ